MTTSQKLAALPIVGALLLGGGAIAGYAGLASAQTPTTAVSGTATTTPWGMHRGGMGWRGHGMHGVVGTVTAVSGNTVTLTGNNGTTYTVDASSAQISKVVTLSVGDIKVGDTVGVQGSVSGTSVTAKHIMDGVPPKAQAPPAQQ
jgi:hypothetical protein